MDRKTAMGSFRVPSQLFDGPHLAPVFFHRLSAQSSPARLGNRPLFCRIIDKRRRPADSKWSFRADGCFDDLAFRHLECLGAREAGVVCTTLEVNDSPGDFEVRLSDLVKVASESR